MRALKKIFVIVGKLDHKTKILDSWSITLNLNWYNVGLVIRNVEDGVIYILGLDTVEYMLLSKSFGAFISQFGWAA